MLGVDAGTIVPVSNNWQCIGTGAQHRVYAFTYYISAGAAARGLAFFPATNGAVPAVVLALSPDVAVEDICGLNTNLPGGAQLGATLAAHGVAVLCPVLMNREKCWSGSTNVLLGGQTLTNIIEHRYWLAHQGFQVGKQMLGIEAATLMTCIEGLATDARVWTNAIAVAGQGREGGRVAMYAGALSPRVAATLVAGAFDIRTNVWTLPLDHHQWGILRYFGDAEVASLLAPRRLTIETPSGCTDIAVASSSQEYVRARSHYAALGVADTIAFFAPAGGAGCIGASQTLAHFLAPLSANASAAPFAAALTTAYSSTAQMQTRFHELQDWLQQRARDSYTRRQAFFWSRLATNSIAAFRQSTAPFRSNVLDDVLGLFPAPDVPLQAWAGLYKTTSFCATYHVLVSLYSNVTSYGLLNVPNDIMASERRPCVICQHGLEGVPQDVADPANTNAYNFFALRLAEAGFITFAPQNPVTYWATFRDIQRRAVALQRDLFGAVVRQHQRQLDFLSSLPFVDSNKFAIYGLSYGGYAALWLGAVEPRYVVSVCAGKFTDTTQKFMNLDTLNSYLYSAYYWTPEHDLWHFDTLNHYADAELAALIAPRSFMVECGIDDGVAYYPWATSEYAKVAALYEQLGIGDETCVDFFEGGHEIHGTVSFSFLEQKLLPEMAIWRAFAVLVPLVLRNMRASGY
jgi:cephalosporin-C deacetylase-like acetyl esterase